MPLPTYVPASSALDQAGLDRLTDLLDGRRVVVLSGAGISTESGIPDYRGPKTRQKARNPTTYRTFTGAPAERQRYWARSFAGWPHFRSARPNAGHEALARLEDAGVVTGVITQNVDRLHQAAGSRRVVDLHGALAEVTCLCCEALTSRDALQARMTRMNPDWGARVDELAPDGDAELDASTTTFQVPTCTGCGGTLKPYVVFFGERVPRTRVDAAWDLYETADVLLVTGSSLAVYSGYRFVLRARREGRDVGIVTLGPTRGDDVATLRVDARLGDVLPRLADRILPSQPPLPP